MKLAARLIGIAWMWAVGAFFVIHGFGQFFLGWPGLVTEHGFFDLWLAGLAALPGFWLWDWGRKK